MNKTKIYIFKFMPCWSEDEVAEWLRRWTANPMCSARVGSNPILVGYFCILFFFFFLTKIISFRIFFEIGF